jgi:hypothetical protein
VLLQELPIGGNDEVFEGVRKVLDGQIMPAHAGLAQIGAGSGQHGVQCSALGTTLSEVL